MKRINSGGLAAFATFLLLFLDASVAVPGPTVAEHIGPAEAMRRLRENPQIILVDVRTPLEYRRAHLAKARLIPLESLERLAPSELSDRDATLLLYCAAGSRSLRAMKLLEKMGYTKLASLTGGLDAWAWRGFPVIRE
jgi:rhodanese-related sulfurtransferase